MPRVSVITPVYNLRPYLGEAVASVLAQTFPDWELLLADDGSRDGSAELARAFADEYPDRVVYLEHEGHRNRGVSATRNLAIRHARGEYLALLDADDVWVPEKLATQVPALDAHPDVGLVFGQAQYVAVHGAPLGRPPYGEGVPGRPACYAERLIQDCCIPASTVVLRRSFLGADDPFPLGLRFQFEDWVLWNRLASRAPFLFVPAVLAGYRVHDANYCRSWDDLRWAEALLEFRSAVFRGELRRHPLRRTFSRTWARWLLEPVNHHADQGRRSRALRILRICASLDPSVALSGSFNKALLKTLLGHRLAGLLRNGKSSAMDFGPWAEKQDVSLPGTRG